MSQYNNYMGFDGRRDERREARLEERFERGFYPASGCGCEGGYTPYGPYTSYTPYAQGFGAALFEETCEEARDYSQFYGQCGGTYGIGGICGMSGVGGIGGYLPGCGCEGYAPYAYPGAYGCGGCEPECGCGCGAYSLYGGYGYPGAPGYPGCGCGEWQHQPCEEECECERNEPTRAELLLCLQELSFTMTECIIYLDTHPTCVQAMMYYMQIQCQYERVLRTYECLYGPMSSYSRAHISPCGCNEWQWAMDAWPWEMEG